MIFMLLAFCMAYQIQAGQSCMTGLPIRKQPKELPRYQTIAEQLQKTTKKIDPALNNELLEAVNSGDTTKVKYLLHLPLPWYSISRWSEKHDAIPNVNALHVNALMGGNWTPLTLAVWNKDATMVKVLLDAGADIDMLDAHGITALGWAIPKNSPEIVKLLIQRHANVNLANVNGDTPLVLAIRSGNREIVQLLLDAGAEIKGASGEKAMRIAITGYHGNQEDILLQLLRAGAQIPQGKSPWEALNIVRPEIIDTIERYNKEAKQQRENIEKATASALPTTEGWQHVSEIIAGYAAPQIVEIEEEKKDAEQKIEGGT